MAMCDGSVTQISYNIDLSVFNPSGTIKEDETWNVPSGASPPGTYSGAFQSGGQTAGFWITSIAQGW
jgi:hypothetical protein